MGKLRCEKLHQNRGIARLVVILTAAALVLLAAAVFWLTAVLIQPETADLPQGEAVFQTVE